MEGVAPSPDRFEDDSSILLSYTPIKNGSSAWFRPKNLRLTVGYDTISSLRNVYCKWWTRWESHPPHKLCKSSSPLGTCQPLIYYKMVEPLGTAPSPVRCKLTVLTFITMTPKMKMVGILGLEPRLGTNLVLLVYKTSDATLHHTPLKSGSLSHY